jgi:16S rRNA (cytosine1402-N4)-methyltransferase
MAQEFTHQPVLVTEVTDLFTPVPAGVIIDATLGGAGHAVALLEARSDVGIFGIDRDRKAFEAAQERLVRFGDRAAVASSRFSRIRALIDESRALDSWPKVPGAGAPAPVIGVLADLGVSSPQIDVAERGFSFSNDGPLDMRMDESGAMTASLFLQDVTLDDLTALLRRNGEGRFARRIARALKDAGPITTTAELVSVVDHAVPKANRRRGHVASRVFQALRIEVNGEEGELQALLEASLDLVAPDGRIVVISYHSGEDAVVKHLLREWEAGGCTCPEYLPCVCGAVSKGVVVTKRALVADEEEIQRNPRSRSARLRAFEVGR